MTLGAARQSLVAEQEGFSLWLVGMVMVVGRVLSVPRQLWLKVGGGMWAGVLETVGEFILVLGESKGGT